jgi:hypothetical protein
MRRRCQGSPSAQRQRAATACGLVAAPISGGVRLWWSPGVLFASEQGGGLGSGSGRGDHRPKGGRRQIAVSCPAGVQTACVFFKRAGKLAISPASWQSRTPLSG